MPTSVRLDPETDATLRRLAARTGRTKSDLLREAVSRLVAEEDQPPALTAYDRMADLVGVEKGGDPTLSQRTAEAVRDKLLARSQR